MKIRPHIVEIHHCCGMTPLYIRHFGVIRIVKKHATIAKYWENAYLTHAIYQHIFVGFHTFDLFWKAFTILFRLPLLSAKHSNVRTRWVCFCIFFQLFYIYVCILTNDPSYGGANICKIAEKNTKSCLAVSKVNIVGGHQRQTKAYDERFPKQVEFMKSDKYFLIYSMC